MKPELIVMLTHNDETVKDAIELFDTLKDMPVKYWGFKDVGLPKDQMAKLVNAMRAANKTTCLEVVSLSEEEGLAGAKLAAETGFDILMGTVFYDSINNFLKTTSVQYYPFIGHVHGHPTILDGTIDEVVAQARQLEAKGVAGIDLLTYRYTGDAPRLLKKVVDAVTIPVVSAGSINSCEMISEVWRMGVWGFTIGGAFFKKDFVKAGTLKDNIAYVNSWLNNTDLPLGVKHPITGEVQPKGV